MNVFKSMGTNATRAADLKRTMVGAKHTLDVISNALADTGRKLEQVVFNLKIPDGTPGKDKLALGPAFQKFITTDADGPVMILPTPHGTGLLTIRSGMELTTDQAEAVVWWCHHLSDQLRAESPEGK